MQTTMAQSHILDAHEGTSLLYTPKKQSIPCALKIILCTLPLLIGGALMTPLVLRLVYHAKHDSSVITYDPDLLYFLIAALIGSSCVIVTPSLCVFKCLSTCEDEVYQ